MTLEECRDLVLEKKTIKIEPIFRKKAYLKRTNPNMPHDGEHTYTGCLKEHGLAYNSGKRSYENPFLKEGEQEAFEKLLNQKEGSLNLYEFSLTVPNFWGTFKIKIPKEGIPLNLENPRDALLYRVLSVNPKFAKSVEESTILEKEYLIVDEKEKKENISALAKKKETAHDFMHKIKSSKKQMANTLRLLGRKVDPDSSIDFLKSELYSIVDEVTVTKGQAGIDKFIEVMEDPLAETKLFVLIAIDEGEIIRDDFGYKNAETKNFLGRTYNDVVKYFLDKNPKIDQEKLIIKERLKI